MLQFSAERDNRYTFRVNCFALAVGKPPEYLLFDRVGDGKIDFKIVYNFAPNVDLWIVYERRDEIPTQFGYDYGKKGKPDRWVNVAPPHQ